MCSAAGGTFSNRPALPDTKTSISSLITPNSRRGFQAMKHVFLINPRAGKRDRTARLRALADRLAAAHGLDVACLVTDRPGGAEHLARSLAETGEDVRLYACGGDGTVHETANGIAGFLNAAMTVIPVGTGNDFLKTSARTLPDSPTRNICGTAPPSPWTSSTATAGCA